QAKQMLINSTAPIRSWLQDNCTTNPDARTRGSELWFDFQVYCSLAGIQRQRDEGRNAFYEQLATLDDIERNGSDFTGIALKNTQSPHPPVYESAYVWSGH